MCVFSSFKVKKLQGVSQVFRIPGADNFGSPKEKLLLEKSKVVNYLQ